MLGVHPGAQDFHHAYVRDHAGSDEGPIYKTLQDASYDNIGSNCYILASSIDPTWFVVCGKSPTGYAQPELDEWFCDITVRGRIDRAVVR